MAVVAAVRGLGVGALTKMVTTVAELRTGLIAMGVAAKTASVSMGAIGIALAEPRRSAADLKAVRGEGDY